MGGEQSLEAALTAAGLAAEGELAVDDGAAQRAFGVVVGGRCVRLGGPDGPLRFLPVDVEEWLEQARWAWLPGESAARTTLRGAETARAKSPQLRLDGLAANVEAAVAGAGSAVQTEVTRVS